MRTLREAAPAKVNFSLEVLAKRADGYHDVRMLLAGLDLADQLSFRQAPRLSLRCSHPDLDCGEGNLVMRAARLLQGLAPGRPGAAIRLRKRIPIAGGLAGGSTDAAATLRGLNRLWRLKFSPARLRSLGARLGSDIPFCVESGWALATGRGERLRKLGPGRRFHLLLANPGFEVSTKWAYSQVRPQRRRQDASRLTFGALRRGAWEAVERYSVNDLEAATLRAHPPVARLKARLLALGAVVSRMSGSGPSVWGLFEDGAKARRAYLALRNKVKFCALTQTIQGLPKPN